MIPRRKGNDRFRTYFLGVAIGLMLVGLMMLMRMNHGRGTSQPSQPVQPTQPSQAP